MEVIRVPDVKGYICPLPCDNVFPRRVVVLGSTGSIGISALHVLEQHPEEFHLLALAAGRNAELLARQAQKWRPQLLAVLDEQTATALRTLLPADYSPEIISGPEGYSTLATLAEADMVLAAQVGAAGLVPAMAAARAGKMIALANKESLVLAGHLFREVCQQTGAAILPVDSEHNALFQGLAGHSAAAVRRLILTASGGPFRGRQAQELATVTASQALQHPNWSMGPKITIDSATLMNKGLEVIEAYHLFGLCASQLEVLVHPQSVIHSLVEYEDRSMLAQLGPADMTIAIAYCLGYPRRLPLELEPLDLVGIQQLTFEQPDTQAFPCLQYALEALKAGPASCVVLSAANEVAVAQFLAGAVGFMDIPCFIDRALNSSFDTDCSCLEAIAALDMQTRARVTRWIAHSST